MKTDPILVFERKLVSDGYENYYYELESIEKFMERVLKHDDQNIHHRYKLTHALCNKYGSLTTLIFTLDTSRREV